MLKDGYCLAESLVLIEYVNEAHPSNPLLPDDPLLRARCRLAIDFINKSVCPTFYKYLQEQDETKWDSLKGQLLQHMVSFGKQIIENDYKYSSTKGSYYLGSHFTLVDLALVPWYAGMIYTISDRRIIRMPMVLARYKGFKLPPASSTEEGQIWARIHEWIEATTSRPSVVSTRSDDEEYFKVYERYARNTADSAVARATRAGISLP
jgi:glutathione S-transferase